MTQCGICRRKLTMDSDIVHVSDTGCVYNKNEIVGFDDSVLTGHVHRACKENGLTYYVEYDGDKKEFSTKTGAEEYIQSLAENSDYFFPDDVIVIEGTARTVVVEKAVTVRIE